MNKSVRLVRHMVIICVALLGLSLSLFMPSSAITQSPMDMTGGNSGNDTGNGLMMGGILGDSANMSMMPFKTGVLAMPMMCSTPSETLESVSGIFGGTANSARVLGGLENMTDAELQKVLGMVVCIPVIDEKMTGGTG